LGNLYNAFQSAGFPLFPLFKGFSLAAPGITPGTTMVVYNSNSQFSQDIADYYRSLRNIPSTQQCGVDVSPTSLDHVSIPTYNEEVLSAIQSHISSNSLEPRCIVLMPDIPLGVYTTLAPSTKKDYVTIDSCLADLTSIPYSEDPYRPIVDDFRLGNPMYNSSYTTDPRLLKYTRIRQSKCSGAVIVSRIDGPSEANIIAMLDSAIAGEALRNAGTPMPSTFYFDRQPSLYSYEDPPGVFPYRSYDQSIQDAGDYAEDIMERTAPVDNDNTRLVSFTSGPASWYCGWYTLGGAAIATRDSWEDGAIAFETDSCSAGSLKEIVYTGGGGNKSDAAFFVSQGVAGTFGSFREPSVSAFPKPHILLKRLFAGLTWGEAFWSSVPNRRWQMIPVGDPLYRPFPRALNQTQS